MYKIIEGKGFTMLEIVVVLGIVSMAMVGISSLVIQNIQVQNVSTNYLGASLLAQEGLELVRNARDMNWLNGAEGDQWKFGNGTPGIVDIADSSGDGIYAIDYDGSINYTLTAANLSGARLYIKNSLYTHDSTAAIITPFYRWLAVADNGDYLAVECHVEWTERGRTIKYVAETDLYNWR